MPKRRFLANQMPRQAAQGILPKLVIQGQAAKAASRAPATSIGRRLSASRRKPRIETYHCAGTAVLGNCRGKNGGILKTRARSS